jgi:hypothetical protein
MADNTATLELKPSELNILGVAGVAVFAIVLVGRAVVQAFESPGGAGAMVPFLAVLGAIGFMACRGLRRATLTLTPAAINFTIGKTVETIPWAEVDEIRLGRISMQRGRNMGIAVQRKTGETLKIHDLYKPGREEVFRFLCDYVGIHASHVVTERERGFFEFG